MWHNIIPVRVLGWTHLRQELKEKNLSLLEPGDIVLGDCGFTVSSDITLQGTRLEIPAFTRGKNQLSQKDVEMPK